jgi:methylmalonyl-CoA/ethylmalonyl-CoA epimerase
MNISRLHHVGIQVSDLAKALAFFRDGLGLPLVYEQPRMAMLNAGENHLELIEPGPDAAVRQQPVEQWEGVHHIALETDDIRAALADLGSKGAPLRSNEPRQLPNYLFAFLAPEAFEGVSVELVETTKAYEPVPEHPQIRGLDHVVIGQPDLDEATRRFNDYLGLHTRREMNRTPTTRLVFLKAGRCILELAGPRTDVTEPPPRRPGRLGGFVFEVTNIDDLRARLKESGAPVGEVHAAVQGGRIVSVHRSGTSGVPVAFIQYDGTAPAGTGLEE